MSIPNLFFWQKNARRTSNALPYGDAIDKPCEKLLPSRKRATSLRREARRDVVAAVPYELVFVARCGQSGTPVPTAQRRAIPFATIGHIWNTPFCRVDRGTYIKYAPAHKPTRRVVLGK